MSLFCFLFLEWKEGQIPHHIIRLISKKIRIPKETKARGQFLSNKKSHITSNKTHSHRAHYLSLFSHFVMTVRERRKETVKLS